MKFLCLAYGAEEDWVALTEGEREALLAQDDLLRARGDLVAPVADPTTVRVMGGRVTVASEPFAQGRAPLAGFSLIEARDLDEAIALVAGTPCAGARGAVEVWPVVGS